MSEHYEKSRAMSYVGSQCYAAMVPTGGATAGSASLAHVSRQIMVTDSTVSGASSATVCLTFAGASLATASATTVRVPLLRPLDWAVVAIWATSAADGRSILATW